MIHSWKGFFIVLILGLVCGLFLGWWLCNREQAVLTNTTSIVDTIKYYKPIPYKYDNRITSGCRFPRLVFAPVDTVVKTKVVIESGDSLDISFPIEKREYRDSTYYAIVSGAVVGDSRPTLDYIETYNTTTTRELVLQPKKFRPFVSCGVSFGDKVSASLGAGGIINNRHIVSAKFTRVGDKNYYGGEYGFIFGE